LPRDVVYDIIVYGDVLEHIDEPAALLREHAELLVDDGVIVGSVPNGYGGFENERRLDRLLRLSDIARVTVRGLRRLRGRPATNPRRNPVPFNEGSPHVVFFTKRSLTRTLSSAGLEIVRFAHGSFVGADLSGSTVLTPRALIDLNARVADHLPSWAVSTWHFAARKRDQAGLR
ncbi:MAG: methyltransferase domain-containing protein, partial [Alphaproteobacteria bacterium]